MEANNWISVKEKMPERGKFVLVQDVMGAIYIGRLWQPDNYPTMFVDEHTHFVSTGVAWQPLPEPYKPKEV